MLLVERDLWQATMDKSLPTSDSSSAKALALIINTIADDQLVHVDDCDTAYAAWHKLAGIHEANDASTRTFLLRKLLTLRHISGSSIQEYIDKIKSLRLRLINAGLELPDEIITSILLIGLPPEYENLVVVLETLGDNLTYDYVITRLLHDERRRNEQGPSSQTMKHDSVLLTKASSSKRPVVRCSYCKKRNHTAEKCYKRIAEEAMTSGQSNTGHANLASTDEFLLSATTTVPSSDNTWVIDSGATNHMCRERDRFVDFIDNDENHSIHIGDGKILTSAGKGDVRIILKNGKSARITSVLYVPGISTNLLSVNRLTSAGYNISFSNDRCNILLASKVVATATLSPDGLYRLDYSTPKDTEYANVSTNDNNAYLWHQRFGHTNTKSILNIAKSGSVHGISLSGRPQITPSEPSRRVLPPRNRHSPVPIDGYMPGESYVAHIAVQDPEPNSYKKAMLRDDRDKWMEAAQTEYNSLMKNTTWSLVPLPKDRTAIGSRWMSRIKRKADGSVNRYKARLVARGFTQQPEIDFEETFAPVAKLIYIHLLAAANSASGSVGANNVRRRLLP
jgi:hypothetical protein